LIPGADDLSTLVDPVELAALDGDRAQMRHDVTLPFAAAEFGFWYDKVAVQRERRGEVLLVVEREDGDVLLHTKTQYPVGGWRLLSGGIRYGEEVLEALVREVREETGVTDAPFDYLGWIAYDLRHGRGRLAFASYLFRVRIGDAKPRVTDPKEAISGFRWVAPHTLDDVAQRLRSVAPAWRDWGAFRAVGHEFAKQRLLGAVAEGEDPTVR
jgi:8-oxo-dGTP pyrophosphatase MutT (NUDIX family)